MDSVLALLLLMAVPEADSGGTPARQISGSISAMDYPAAAIRAHAEGTSTVELTVGVDGSVTQCRIAASAGHPSLDETACRLASDRFRFEPARDRAGQTVEIRTTRRITWRLPDDGPSILQVLPEFVAGAVMTTLGGTLDQRPRCAVDYAGPTFRSGEPAACFGYERATRAELAGLPMVQTITMRLELEGEASPPFAVAAEGELIAEMAAEVEIDPYGLMRGCMPVPTTLPLPAQTPHMCDTTRFGMPAFRPFEGQANRRGTMRVEVRLRSPAQQAPRT